MTLPRHKLYSVPCVLELTFSEVLAALATEFPYTPISSKPAVQEISYEHGHETARPSIPIPTRRKLA
jgi:hypothetical protein